MRKQNESAPKADPTTSAFFGRVEVMRQLHEGETKLDRAEFARAAQKIFHYVLDKDHQTNGQISDEQILMSLFCH